MLLYLYCFTVVEPCVLLLQYKLELYDFVPPGVSIVLFFLIEISHCSLGPVRITLKEFDFFLKIGLFI